MTARLLECIDVADTLGEGVLWRAEDATVWWTDIHGRRLHCLDWPSLRLRTFAAPERVGSFAFVEGRDDVLLCAFETGFALFAPEDGRLVWLDRPAALGGGMRMNDGRADPQGRFWAGSMAEGEAAKTPRGVLYRLGPEGRADPILGGLGIPNALCWSPAGDRIYFADTVAGELYAAPYDAASGVFARPAMVNSWQGEAPDGAVTDAAGDLWLAMWGGGRVARLSPGGEEVGSLDLDAPQPTCTALGGPDGDLLFVTSARDGLAEAELAARPRSGGLFVFQVGAQGQAPSRVRLSRAAARL